MDGWVMAGGWVSLGFWVVYVRVRRPCVCEVLAEVQVHTPNESLPYSISKTYLQPLAEGSRLG